MKSHLTPAEGQFLAPIINRRDALRSLAAGAIGMAAAQASWLRAASPSPQNTTPSGIATNEFLFFSKPFQSLTFDELGELAASCGYTGLEFPVRPGGHIQPEAVEEELPRAMAAFKQHGINVPLITTGINEVSKAQHTERVLRTAAGLGIRYFRMAYYRYDLNRPVQDQLREIAPKLNDLVAAAAEIGMKPLYQNHSGSQYVGAPLWDIYSLIREHSPEKIGLAYDIGHAVVEATQSWPIDFNLVHDYIDVAYIKEPVWDPDRKRFGWAPIGTGLIPSDYFALLKRSGFRGPISIHVEYLDHGDPATARLFRQAIRDDLTSLRRQL